MIDLRQPVFPVRVVLRRTGLSAELLRAWERRYGVVAPSRTEGGQRLYSEADVARLALLRRATMHGHSIGRIASLSDPEIEGLIDADAALPAAPTNGGMAEVAQSARKAALDAIQWMDGAGLDAALRRAAMTLGPVPFGEGVVAPLSREIGELWHSGRLRIVQEHFATAAIRQVLGAVLGFTAPGPDAPVFASATISGQHHEIGAMLAAITATSVGWRAVYLGPDLPGAEIGLATGKLRASALGLSFTYALEPEVVATHLEQVADSVPRAMPVYAGGESAGRYRALFERFGIIEIGSLAELGDHLTARTERARG